jgi:hypothetical protein
MFAENRAEVGPSFPEKISFHTLILVFVLAPKDISRFRFFVASVAVPVFMQSYPPYHTTFYDLLLALSFTLNLPSTHTFVLIVLHHLPACTTTRMFSLVVEY